MLWTTILTLSGLAFHNVCQATGTSSKSPQFHHSLTEVGASSSGPSSTISEKKRKSNLIDPDAQLDEYLARKDRVRGPRNGLIINNEEEIQPVSTESSRQPLEGEEQSSYIWTNRKSHPASDTNYWESMVSRHGVASARQYKRRQDFDRVWREQRLSLDMDPVELADKVLAMRGQGVEATSSTSLAAQFVKNKRDAQYEMRYFARITQLSNYMSRERAHIANHPQLSKLDMQVQMEKAIEATLEAVKVAEMNRKKQQRKSSASTSSSSASLSASTVPPLTGDKLKEDTELRFQKMARVIQTHLDEKGLNFYTMPLNQLVAESRGLHTQFPELTSRQYTRSLYRYIQHHRNESYEAMAVVKRKYKKQ